MSNIKEIVKWTLVHALDYNWTIIKNCLFKQWGENIYKEFLITWNIYILTYRIYVVINIYLMYYNVYIYNIYDTFHNT